MNSFFAMSKEIWRHLSDDTSRKIYTDGILYNMLEDESFLDDEFIALFQTYLRKDLELFLEQKEPVYIFGAGRWGKRLRKMFDASCFRAYIDNYVSSKNRTLMDLPIYSPQQLESIEDNAKYIIAIDRYADEAMQQLLSMRIKHHNIWNMKQKINENNKKLEKEQYFDLTALSHDSNEIFVDVGAFDGASSKRFIEWAQGSYKHIYLFEANQLLYETCMETLKNEENCTFINKGCWNKKQELTFYESPHDNEYNVSLSDHNCFDSETENMDLWEKHCIPVDKLDSMLKDERVTFIKMDIEGSEANALQGAKKIIQLHKPKLAISVYHKKDDLWVLPDILLQYRPDYRFYLRNYSFGWGETVLYAV